MKLTEQQKREAFQIYLNDSGVAFDSFCAAIESIPEPLPTLRPIAEMSEKVPEGCVRVLMNFHDDGSPDYIGVAHPQTKTSPSSFACDILLPVESEEDKWRAEFEAWATQTSPQRHLWDTFTEEERGWIFNAWKAAKSTTQL